jgi:hypothetical protein
MAELFADQGDPRRGFQGCIDPLGKKFPINRQSVTRGHSAAIGNL